MKQTFLNFAEFITCVLSPRPSLCGVEVGPDQSPMKEEKEKEKELTITS
jgi:hypothetical protein